MRRSLLKDNAPLLLWLVRLCDPLLVILVGWLAYRWYLGTWILPERYLTGVDRRGGILFRAVSAAAPLRAAARRDAVRGNGPAGERLVADRRRVVRLPVPVEIGRGIFPRLGAVLDRIRRGHPRRVSRRDSPRPARIAPAWIQPASYRRRRSGAPGAGHRAAPGGHAVERPFHSSVLRRRPGAGGRHRRRRRRARQCRCRRGGPRGGQHRPGLDRAAAARGRAHPLVAAAAAPPFGRGASGPGHLQFRAAQSFDDRGGGPAGDQPRRIATFGRESRDQGCRGHRAVRAAAHRSGTGNAADRGRHQAVLARAGVLRAGARDLERPSLHDEKISHDGGRCRSRIRAGVGRSRTEARDTASVRSCAG